MSTMIISSMKELCRVLNMEGINIHSIEPCKGIANEDLVKVTYNYKEVELD